MKTTLEIPDKLFREAKAAAARQGIPLRELVTEAIADKLNRTSGDERPWLQSFGKLKSLKSEIAQINKVIEQEFGQIEPEDRS